MSNSRQRQLFCIFFSHALWTKEQSDVTWSLRSLVDQSVRFITVHTEMSDIFITELHLLNEICYQALFPESIISHACSELASLHSGAWLLNCVFYSLHTSSRAAQDEALQIRSLAFKKCFCVIICEPHYIVTVLKSQTCIQPVVVHYSFQ